MADDDNINGRQAGASLRARVVWSMLLAIAWLCLALGLCLPIIRFERLYFFSDAPSLVGLVAALWTGGDLALAVLVGLFSVLLPVVKLIALTAGAAGLRRGDGRAVRLARLLPYLAKWSMMDVMLVALVIFAAKTSGLAAATTQPGLWFYAGSALIAGLLPMLQPKR